MQHIYVGMFSAEQVVREYVELSVLGCDTVCCLFGRGVGPQVNYNQFCRCADGICTYTRAIAQRLCSNDKLMRCYIEE